MGAIIENLDEMFPEWQPDPERVFPCDAFISHKWQDPESDKLRDRLRSRGLEVWHDGHQNLADQRVVQKISQAMINSRTVVVCCSASFDDSSWCRAEYLSALKSGTLCHSNRVVLAIMSPQVELPKDLRFKVPHFRLYDDEQFEELCRYLKHSNKLPYDPSVVSNELSFLEVDTYLREIQKVHQGKEFVGRGGRIWDALVADKITADEIAKIDAEAPYLTLTSDYEGRAVAIGQLCDLDRFYPSVTRRRTILRLLAQETSEVVVNAALQWMVLRCVGLSNTELQLFYRAVMPAKTQITMYYSTLLNTLPSVIRARVHAKGVDPKLLSLREQILLCRKRVDFLLAEGADETDGFAEIRIPQALCISEIEIVLRELTGILMRFSEKADLGGDADEIRAVYLTMIERIVEHSNANLGLPLSSMKHFVCDQVLIPVMACLEGTTRNRARDIFISVCDFMEKFGAEYASKHVLYRQGLADHTASPKWPPSFSL